MSRPLVRFARRLSTWEPGTSDDHVLQTEFSDRDRGHVDLRPSVYEIAAEDAVRAYAEYATAFHPPPSGGGVDLGGTVRPVERSPGDTGFSFTMNAHREVVLAHRNDLLALVREVRGSMAGRMHRVSRGQVVDYARKRLMAGDQEWEQAQAQETAQNWLKKINV